MSEESSRNTAKVSRRRAIGIGGAAAATAWAAPSILAIDKVGAAGTGTIVFRAAVTGTGGPGNNENVVVTIPATPNPFTVGDRLLAVAVIRWDTGGNGNATLTAPDGWTIVGAWAQPLQTAAPGLRAYLFTRTYDGAGSYTFARTGNGNGTQGTVMILGFGGVDATPFDGATSSSGKPAAAPVVAAAANFNTTIAFDLALFIGGSFGDASATTWTTPSGYTPIAEAPNTAFPEVFVASRELPSPGSIGSPSSTITGASNNSWAVFNVALRPV